MPSNTNKLGLVKHTTADSFHIADYTANWDKIDSFPGTFICTSGTRPSTWGAGQTGMQIYETDTKLAWRWSGSAWERVLAKGFLSHNERISDLATTNTTYVSVVGASTVIPSGNRRVLVVVECSGVASSVGLTQLAIFRGATLLAEWYNEGGLGSGVDDQSQPANYALTDLPTAGTHTYSFQFRAVVGYGGTSTIKATSNTRTAINVIEV